MAVGVVLVGLHAEGRGLHAAGGADGLGFGVLLAEQGGEGELAELELCLDAEQRGGAPDEGRAGGHGHVAGLEGLDDLVLLAFVRELEVLAVEIEGGVGVVGHVELHLVAYGGRDVGLYLLVEVEVCLAARGEGEGGIVGLVGLDSHAELHAALRGEADSAGAEDFLQRAQGEVHVEDVERLLVLFLEGLGVALPEVLHHALPEAEPVVVARGELHGRDGHLVADACVEVVHARGGVVYHLVVHVLGVAEVGGVLSADEGLVALRECGADGGQGRRVGREGPAGEGADGHGRRRGQVAYVAAQGGLRPRGGKRGDGG